MSSLDQHAFAVPARMAEFEARVQWLETTLERVLGEDSSRRTPVGDGARRAAAGAVRTRR